MMSLKDLATKLVGFNTISSESPLPMADFICEYLEGCGFVIESYPYVQKGVRKVNVIARKGGQDSKLVYSGHMDTVPCGSGWDKEFDPFALVERNIFGIGRFFQGLGIADMKFFLAIAMRAGESIAVKDLKYPFALCFTSDEEVGCRGVRKLLIDLKGKLPGKYIVIGEPTNFRPVYMHKGYVSFKVSVGAFKDKHGSDKEMDNPCHSSNPRTTTNAVERALGPVIDELNKFRLSLEKVEDHRFDPPFPTMNIGGNIVIGRIKVKENKKTVDGDSSRKLIEIDKVAKNIIPRGFTIEGDVRVVPGQEPVDIMSIMRANIEERIRNIETTVENEKWEVKVDFMTYPSAPMITPKDSLLVRLIEDLAGQPAETSPYNTEGSAFNSSGGESVIWGPADIKQAHKDNEYVLAELFKEETVEKYIRLIRRMCT